MTVTIPTCSRQTRTQPSTYGTWRVVVTTEEGDEYRRVYVHTTEVFAVDDLCDLVDADGSTVVDVTTALIG